MGKQIVWAPPIPPLCPEQQRRLQMMYESVQSSAAFVDLEAKPPPIQHPKQVNPAAVIRPPRRPTRVVFTPLTIINLSASTCATSSEADIYSRLANARGDSVFVILDPATGIADDEFKASIIKRYRDESVAASSSDEVPQASFLRRHCESSETVVAESGIPDQAPGASVLKRHRQDEPVDATSGIADGVLGASLLKRHCAEPGESSENVVADLSLTTGSEDEVLGASVPRPFCEDLVE